MIDSTKKYIAVSDGVTYRFSEKDWLANKDAFMKDNPRAEVAEVDAYKVDDTDDNDSLIVRTDKGDFSFTGKQWKENEAEFMKDFPNAAISRVRGVDYYYNQANELDEQIKAKDEEIKVWQDSRAEKTGADWSSVMMQQSGFSPIGAGLDPERDAALAKYAAEGTRLQAERDELENLFNSNPRVVEARERAKEMEQEYREGLMNQVNDILATYEDDQDILNEKIRKAEIRTAVIGGEIGTMPALSGPSSEVRSKVVKYDKMGAAKEMLQHAKDIREGKTEGFWKGVGHFGVKEIKGQLYQNETQSMVQIALILKDLNEKVGNLNKNLTPEVIDANLSKEDALLLRSYLELMSAQDEVGTGWKYKAGEIAAAAVPFAIEFALMGGFADDVAVGATRGLQYALEKWVAEGIEQGGKALGRKAVKYGVNLATKGALKAGILTALRPSTYSTIAQHLPRISEDGDVKVGKNILTGVLDSTIETISELSGGVMNDILGLGLKWGKGVTSKMFGDAVKNIKFPAWGKVLTNGAFGDYLKQAGFQGLPFEILEEYVGNTMRLVYDKDSLAEMHRDGNGAAMWLGFVPMTLFGAATSAAAFRVVDKRSAELGERLNKLLRDKGFAEKRANALTERRTDKSPLELNVQLRELREALAEKGATKEELAIVDEFGLAVAEFQTMRGVTEIRETQQLDEVKSELDAQYGNVEHNGNVTTAETKDGKKVFIVSEKGANGEYAAIDQQTGQHFMITDADIKEQVNEQNQPILDNGQPVQVRETKPTNQYLTDRLAEKNRLKEAERMLKERSEQIAKINELMPDKLNLGTESEPNVVAVKSKDSKGVTVVAANGNEAHMSWDAVGRAMGMPIHVFTDMELTEMEAQEIALKREALKAARAKTYAENNNVAEELEGIKKQLDDITPKPEVEYTDEETGLVDEVAFWENDPEGFCDWNDRQNKDGGKDSIEQLENTIQSTAKLLNDALAAAKTDNPVARKAANREAKRLTERLERLQSIQNKYLEKFNEQLASMVESAEERAEMRIAMRERINEWRKKFNLDESKLTVYESLDEVENETAKAQIMRANTPGWADGTRESGMHAYIYLPHVKDMSHLDKTIMHEVVTHFGLKTLLGEKEYNNLMDKVWNMMSDSARRTMSYYAGVQNREGDDRRRTAAEEFVARVAENIVLDAASAEDKSLWGRVSNFIAEQFDKMEVKLNGVDVAGIVKDNYNKLEAEGSKAAETEETTTTDVEVAPETTTAVAEETAENIQENITAQAEAMTNENGTPAPSRSSNGTEVYSTATANPWIDNLGHEHRGTMEVVLERMAQQGFSKQEIKQMKVKMQTAYDYMMKLQSLTNPDGSVRFAEFNAWAEKTPYYKQIGRNFVKAITSLVSNGDYPINLELTTDCIKREAFTMLLNELVKRGADLAGMGPAEIVTIQKMMKQYGIQVACALCFVEGKRLQIVNWASQIVDDWNDALLEAGIETDEMFEFGKDGDAFIPADEWRTYEDKPKLAKTLRTLDEIAKVFQGLDPETFKEQIKKNKRDLAEYKKQKSEAWAAKNNKPASAWKPTKEQEREMKKIKVAGLAPVFVNENMKAFHETYELMRNEWMEKNPGKDPLSFTPNSKQWQQLETLRNNQIKDVKQKMVRLIMEYPEMRKKMTLNDLLGSKGLMEIRQQHGVAYEQLYSIILQRFGTGTPKPVQDAVPYDGEVMTLTESAFKAANKIGGARLFSFSDFDITKVFDYMQMFFDLEANKQMLQSYTKEVAAVLLFGRSNAKFNISTLASAVVPAEVMEEYNSASEAKKKDLRHQWAENAGLLVDENGNITGISFSEEHSVSPEFAQQIFHDDSRNKDCGAIMVGASVNHAIYSAAQAWIRMVIPFHLSGMPIAARDKTDVKWWTDNTEYQSTRKKTKDGWSKISDKENTFEFYADMHQEGWNMRDKAREYLDWCKSNAYRPKFDWGINSDYYRAYCEENGYTPNQQIIDMMDADTTNGVWNQYYKFLTDFTAYKPVFNEEGEMIDEIPSPQQRVVTNFDMSEMEKQVIFEGENSMLARREGNIALANQHVSELADRVTPFLNGEITEEEMGLRDDVFYDARKDANAYLEAKEGNLMYSTNGNASAEDIQKTIAGNIQNRIATLVKAENYIKRNLRNKKSVPRFEFTLPTATLNRIRAKMGRDFDSHNIEIGGIRHALKNHGVNGKKNTEKSIPIREEDTLLIPYIMTAPDLVEKGSTKNNRESVRFTKFLSNGYVMVVEKEWDESPNDLETINIWAELSDASNATKALDSTSETTVIGRSDAAKIRKDAEDAIAFEEKLKDPALKEKNTLFSTRSSEERARLFDAAKAEFGVTNNFKVAGYMLPDGSLLDFSEVNNGGPANVRTRDHREIGSIMEDRDYDSRTEYITDFLNEGAIRIMPESDAINLSVAPSAEQREKLLDFFYKKNGYIILEIDDQNGRSAAYVEYDKGTSPYRIMRDIDGYFNEGIVPQQNIMFSTSNTNQAIFVSNAAKAVEGIKMEKATPEQWLKMIEKNGGLKAGEDKWMGLSDWLKSSDKKTLTKDEVLAFINDNMIVIEEQHYSNEEMGKESVKILNERYHGWEDAFSFEWDGYMEEPSADISDYAAAVELYNKHHDDKMTLDEDGEFEDMNAYEKVRQFGVELSEIYHGSKSEVRPIEGIREQYTTQGLEHLREIALTVPTIESWGATDDTHFGDAGDGRAVAWIRFGDTFAYAETKEGKEYKAFVENMLRRYHIDEEVKLNQFGTIVIPEELLDALTDEQMSELQRLKAASMSASDKTEQRILVIDEIQSKRHQEGREKGYKSDFKNSKEAQRLKAEVDRVTARLLELEKDRRENSDAEQTELARLDILLNEAQSNAEYDAILAEQDKIKAHVENRESEILAVRSERRELAYQLDKQIDRDAVDAISAIPDAPFEKNWHELAMKRMLRYAAENGYDAIAWTKGDQQAERYNIGGVVEDIYYSGMYPVSWDSTENVRYVDINLKNGHIYHLGVNEDGFIEAEYNGVGAVLKDENRSFKDKSLSDVVGKEVALQIMQMKDNSTLKAEDIKVGGEGMKGFYDKMLPAFMNKYGKKWGIKVEDINLPNLENGLTMHSVPVTEEMKESVMEGQLMFSTKITPEMDAKYLSAVEAEDMETAQKMVDEAARLAGYTIRGDHGRVSKFTIFDRNKANPEGNWGQGFYFTNNEEDAEENYATVESPDLENKIEREVERRIERAREEGDVDEDGEVDEFTIREEVEDEFITAEPNTVHAAIRMENPFIVGHGMVEFDENGNAKYDMEETFLTSEFAEDEDGEIDYDVEPTGTLVDLVNALNEELSEYEWANIDANQLLQDAYDGMTASQFEQAARELLGSHMDYLVNDEGSVMTSEILRAAIERAGYDGIVDNTVNQKFGTERRDGGIAMEGMDRDTRHYISFQSSNIKATDPVTYDDAGNVIPLSQRFNSANQDIRFSTKSTTFDSTITPEVRKEMDVISAQAIVNGNYLKAPNGKDTKLTPEQWALVRTQNFKRWFGDWENDPENASKVVDENGEPMVVYHGTAGVINKFEDQQRSPGFWFVDREDVANGYAESAAGEFGEEKNIIPVFLNIRNPRIEDAHEEYPVEFALKSYVENDNGVYEVFDTYEEAEDYRAANVPDGWVGAAEVGDQHDLVERAKELGYDGVVMLNMHDQATYAETRVEGTQTNYVVLDANQIKSATENNGEYSESGDIRFSTRQPNQTAVEFHQAVVDDFKSKYKDIADIQVFPINEETARRFGYTLDDLKEIGGLYDIDEDLIAIFAKEDTTNSLYVEDIIFHESVHKLSEFFEYLKDAGRWMWEIADKYKGFAFYKNHILEKYEEKEYHKEMLSYMLGTAMAYGGAAKLYNGVPEEIQKHIDEIFNEIGYDRERESNERLLRLDDESSVEEAEGSKREENGGRGESRGNEILFSTEEERPVDEIVSQGRMKASAEVKSAMDERMDKIREINANLQRLSKALGIPDYITEAEEIINQAKQYVSSEEVDFRVKENLKELIASAENSVTQSERNDAIDQLVDKLIADHIRTAASAQREYDRETVDVIVKLAKDILDNGSLSDMTRGEVKRLLGAINSATGRRNISKSVNRLMDVMIANQLRMGRENIDKFLRIRGKKVDARGVEVRGKLDIEGQQIMDAVRENIGLELVDILFRMVDVEDRLSSDSETIRRNAENELVGLELAKRYVENIKDSEKEEKTLRQEKRDATEEYKAGKMDSKSYRQFANSIDEAIRENRIQRVLAYQRLADDFAKMVTQSIRNAGQLREAEKRRIEKIQHFANSDMKGLPSDEHSRVDSFWMNNPVARFLLKPLATFDQMLRHFGSKSVNGEGYLWNHFMRGWLSATESEYKGVQKAHEVLDAKAKELFGLKRWSDIFEIDRKLPTAILSWWDGGEMKDHEVTQGNLLYIYMVNKMTDGKMKLRKMGISEEDVNNIARSIDPRFVEMADWLQDEFLPSLRDRYNTVHERLFGAPMAAIDNYFPIRVLANARVRDVDIAVEESSAKPSTITGSIIKRTKNSLALDILGSNAFDVVLEHVQQMEHWAAFAEFNQDLNTLLSYKKFRNRVQNMSGIYGSGNVVWNNFRSVAELAAGVYQPASKADSIDKTALNLAKGVTSAKISFRVYTAIKQLLSMPAFVSDARADDLLEFILTPWEAWKWSMENLPLFEKRWKSRQAGDSRLMQTDSDWKMWKTKVVELASRYGMSPNAFVDAVTVAIGARSIYESKKRIYKKMGYSEEQADDRAKQDATILFNESQQSNESAFLSTMQVDRTAASVAFSLFRNSSMGYQRMFVDALRNIKHKFTKGYKEESIEFMKKQLIRDGIDEAKAERSAERMYTRSMMHSAMRVATFGFLVQFAWNLGAYLPYLLAGDDDDEKDNMVKDAARHAMFGPMEGLSGGSILSELGNMIASGEELSNYDPTLLPVVSDVKKLFNMFSYDEVAAANEMFNILLQAGIGVNPQTLTDAAVAIVDACNGDLGTAKEAALCLLRILQIPQSQADMIYIDEIDFTADKGLDLTIKEFAKRYADYKVKRGAPVTGWMYSDEKERERENKYIQRFLKTTEELKRSRGSETAKQYYDYLDNEYKEMTEKIRDLKSKAADAEARGNNAEVDKYDDLLDRLMSTARGRRYEEAGEYVRDAESAKSKMKKSYGQERRENEEAMLEARRKAVEEFKKLGGKRSTAND